MQETMQRRRLKMTQATHTPGPWYRNTSAKYPIYSETTPGQKDWKHLVAILQRGVSEEEQEANLNLVTASPDILAALEFCAEFIEFKCQATFGDPDYMDCLNQAREAIAKAKGE